MPNSSFIRIPLKPSGYLETADRAGEMSLFQQLFTEAKVYLVPGSMFGCKIPGWFRIIFAVTPERWEECILEW